MVVDCSKFFPPLLFSLLYLQHCTYSEFPLKYKNGFWSLLQGKRVEVKFENKNKTQLLTKGIGMFVLEIITFNISFLPSFLPQISFMLHIYFNPFNR